MNRTMTDIRFREKLPFSRVALYLTFT